jgi:transcriptional activator of cad operon
MEQLVRLRIGEWCVDPASGEIWRDGQILRLEVRSMRVLLCLASHPGEVVSIDDLLHEVWPDVAVSSDSVYQAVASLRRLLGDDPKQPLYIATVPRLGYRLVAALSPCANDLAEPATNGNLEQTASPKSRRFFRQSSFLAASVIVVLLLIGVATWGFLGRSRVKREPAIAASLPQKSVAVLPFLDLTEGMKEGEFADGMTEELIDKLGKIPDLHVAPPTSSFYFKDKQVSVGEIAKTLGVAYVLDGSVRKSGSTVRVAARLIRADSGFVAWTETYDRPFNDLLVVQDNIAGQVAKALSLSIKAESIRPAPQP